MKIKSKKIVKLEKPIPVYDITVDQYNTFVCEGVVVHNSDGIPGFAKLGEVAAKHYAKQILANESIDFSKLEKAPRTPAEGLISLINDPQRFWDNTKLMNLDYIFETNDPLLQKINIGILKSNIFDIDEFGVKGKLQEFQMRTACNFIQHVIESNENNPLKDYIKLFLN